MLEAFLVRSSYAAGYESFFMITAHPYVVVLAEMSVQIKRCVVMIPSESSDFVNRKNITRMIRSRLERHSHK